MNHLIKRSGSRAGTPPEFCSATPQSLEQTDTSRGNLRPARQQSDGRLRRTATTSEPNGPSHCVARFASPARRGEVLIAAGPLMLARHDTGGRVGSVKPAFDLGLARSAGGLDHSPMRALNSRPDEAPRNQGEPVRSHGTRLWTELHSQRDQGARVLTDSGSNSVVMIRGRRVLTVMAAGNVVHDISGHRMRNIKPYAVNGRARQTRADSVGVWG